MGQKWFENKNSTENLSRRGFLVKVWKWLGVAALIQFTWVGGSILGAGRIRNEKTGQRLIVAGKVSDFEPGNVYPFHNGQFYLVRFKDGGFMALSLKCSHLGCSILWNETEQTFNCPCHASAFNNTGAVIHPPAPRPLDYYPITVEDGLIRVNTSTPVKRRDVNTSQITFV